MIVSRIHPEDRAQSFRIKVSGADHDLAMQASAWLGRVKVIIYKNPKFRYLRPAGHVQFN